MGTNRYVIEAKVREVKILEEVKKGYHDKSGNAEIVRESVGWFVSIDRGNLSFHVGDTDPGWRPGDKVRLIIERVTTK